MDNYSNKLVFVGNMGAGKSTAIRAISDIEPVSTDMPISADADAMDGKTLTTVALDYSSVELEGGELLHVYGVPGQRYLDFMWPMVCEGAMGIVVLVNACEGMAIDGVADLLLEFGRLAPDASFVVGVTRTDLAPTFELLRFRDGLKARGFTVPVLKVDARQTLQVEFLVKALLSCQHAGAQLQQGTVR
ncbi:GTPase [Xanthomonas sp. XNM01]|uniref:GTP-binding protein n=1 Tax=Xanthomonas sp. XNM01 TaxID=2769289 RepID=UPI00177E7A39|nr:GTPase [Xanthomonas sp. XNM01]MBD9367507.1 GTPase [Xanthomonas sp. XNM01]